MRCGISRATLQRLEGGSVLSPKISEKMRAAAQCTLDDSKATGKEKALARKILKQLDIPRRKAPETRIKHGLK
jgi:hypothetical protein